MKNSIYPENLNADQLEILKYIQEKEEKIQNRIHWIIGISLFIAFDLIGIFLINYFAS